ncbi:MAG: MFS transporter [Planctomycetes bacterium]|nr:MFS transporter [Planctomycetota bacterium]
MIAVLRHAAFRRLWLAQIVSACGDWLNRVALLATLARLDADHALAGIGALYGVEMAVRLLPVVFAGPVAGPLSDRVSRKALMIAADVLRAGIVSCFLFVDEPGEVPLLYGLLAAQMAVSVVFEASRTAALPGTVPPEDLHAAYVLTSATWSVMLTAGSALGGLLVAAVGAGPVFLIDAASYLVSAALLLRLALPAMPVQAEPFRWRDVLLLSDMRRGLDHVRERGATWAVLVKTFWWPVGGFLVMLSVAGAERFGANDPSAPGEVRAAGFAVGMLFAARGLGTGLGPIVGGRLFGQDDAALLRQVSGGFLVAAAGYLGFGYADDLWTACAWVFAAHLGGASLWVASTLLWQRHVEDAFRGRVATLEMLGLTVAFSVGGLLAGALYDGLGDEGHVTALLCAATAVMGVLWTLLQRRAARARAAGRSL